jgi:type IV secretion system protein VirB3
MSEKSEKNIGRVGVDPLYKGLTRPVMLFGLITYNWGIVIMISVGLCVMWTKSLYTFLFAAVEVFAAYLICAREPKLLDLVVIGAKTTAVCWPNRAYHGNTSSYDYF